ncbi:hypothetical protein HYALB_00001531 [Hymenoscyphus albidus]|uniref:Uncharacterized protein n=1 Tax=Hymenoscyphus albidus TaxID=595503 RepID=A0A9N9LAS5_9HELO|nr:hypothetical protein HYALB_00001531 [Hymenoscyphus albidus]
MDINNLSPDQLCDFLQEYGTEIERMNCKGIHGPSRQRHMWNWIPVRYRDMEYPTYQTCRKARLRMTFQNQVQKYLGAREHRKDRLQEDGWQKYPRGEGDLTDTEKRMYAGVHQRYSEIIMEEIWGEYFAKQREMIEDGLKVVEEKQCAEIKIWYR